MKRGKITTADWQAFDGRDVSVELVRQEGSDLVTEYRMAVGVQPPCVWPAGEAAS